MNGPRHRNRNLGEEGQDTAWKQHLTSKANRLRNRSEKKILRPIRDRKENFKMWYSLFRAKDMGDRSSKVRRLETLLPTPKNRGVFRT